MPPWMADWYGGGSSSGPIVETVCTVDCVSSETTDRQQVVTFTNGCSRGIPRAGARSRERARPAASSVPIASLPCELYVTFSFFSSGCRSPSLPSPMPNDDGTNSLPRHDGHGSLLLFDRTAPGASMTRMTKYEFPLRRVLLRGVARTQSGNRGLCSDDRAVRALEVGWADGVGVGGRETADRSRAATGRWRGRG